MSSTIAPQVNSAVLRAAAVPENVGFSGERLLRITRAFHSEVNTGGLPGAVVLVARKGQIVLSEAYGFRDREAGAPMRFDDIFRIASMTKPITIVAALMLAEEGKLLLPEAVGKYLPEFADLKVGVEGPNGQLSLIDLKQPMTVHDLMRHTSGLTYGLFGKSVIKTRYNQAGVFSLLNTNEQMAKKLAELPLCYQPGTTFDYGMSTDVLGRIIEVISGQTLGEFLNRRLFVPLGMKDTGFAVPHGSGRIAQPQADPVTGVRVPMADPLVPMPWESGGAGLSSTACDYLHFSQMLLNDGELDGTRYLSPFSVRLMSSDHLPSEVAFDPATLPLFGGEAPMPIMGQGFGLGVAVRTHDGVNPLPGSVGNYYWGGALGTYFWIDPKEQLIAIMMTQAPADRLRYRYLIQQLVYQALVI
ncbi:MAG: beta-lactamase family protein [Acidobacteriota bacterium]|nr:beta-lactamase family protein [Acidobacteriota bacterium]